jgi:hypothetical protein
VLHSRLQEEEAADPAIISEIQKKPSPDARHITERNRWSPGECCGRPELLRDPADRALDVMAELPPVQVAGAGGDLRQ